MTELLKKFLLPEELILWQKIQVSWKIGRLKKFYVLTNKRWIQKKPTNVLKEHLLGIILHDDNTIQAPLGQINVVMVLKYKYHGETYYRLGFYFFFEKSFLSVTATLKKGYTITLGAGYAF